MSSYGIDFSDQEGVRGPYNTTAEVREALNEWLESHPNDSNLAGVHVWEMRPYGSAAGERSVLDFLQDGEGSNE